jgi:hypothetical protein
MRLPGESHLECEAGGSAIDCANIGSERIFVKTFGKEKRDMPLIIYSTIVYIPNKPMRFLKIPRNGANVGILKI